MINNHDAYLIARLDDIRRQWGAALRAIREDAQLGFEERRKLLRFAEAMMERKLRTLAEEL